MLKREEIQDIKVEDGKVFIYMVNGKKREVKSVRNKEFLKNRLKKENFDNLTFLVEDYNYYNRECKRVFKFAKSRYLMDYGIEFFHMSNRENGTLQWYDGEPHRRIRDDYTVVKGTIYYINRHKTDVSILEKLHNAFDNVIVSKYTNGNYSIFVGTKKMRNYK